MTSSRPARLLRLLVLWIVILTLAACSTIAANQVPRGQQDFRLTDWDGPGLPVSLYEPPCWQPDSPVIIVLHGSNRNLRFVLDSWRPLADQRGFLLVVPHFDDWRFPGTDYYSLGGVLTGQIPRNSAFNAIEPLFAEAKRRTGSTVTEYRLFGHSAGAQFVHRFVLLKGGTHIDRAVSSMAGWYTMPDPAVRWPYGLGNTDEPQAVLDRALATKLMVQLGGLDNNPRAQDLRTTREAVAQGRTRIARGRNFFAAGEARAAASRKPFGWVLSIEPELGHDSAGAAKAAIDWLLEDTIAGRTPAHFSSEPCHA